MKGSLYYTKKSRELNNTMLWAHCVAIRYVACSKLVLLLSSKLT